MQYMLMCCINEARWTKLPDSERGRIMDAYGKLVQELKQNGQLLAGAQLNQTSTAITVRKKDGKPLIVDGPFAETKEQFGGYHVVECKDQDEAISLALRIPTLAAGGTIEVRPVLRAE
ncbi:MAG: YciI family protein [Phycisphaerales bacterium]|nr:YciI family protein [Phycisphaerales bacterium]MCI0629765.1 YciI family protein [Phycisphaerales bacterium]MCI0676500.1 YciI family protein [Phycisphaerales bacterium]